MKHSESLIKLKLISEKFDFKEILNDGLKGKAITAGILIFEVILLFIFVTTSDFYHRYTYHNKVQTLLATNNKIELNNMYVQVVESGSKDSLFYIIVKSMEDPRKPLRASITAGFSSYSEDVQDTVTKLFIDNKLPIFTDEFLALRLIDSDFHLKGFEEKALTTHPQSNIKNVVSFILKKTINEYDGSDIGKIISRGFQFNTSSSQSISNIQTTIRVFRKYFTPLEDSLWRELQIKFWVIDTLSNYYHKIETDAPERPEYVEPTFDGPVYISGVSMPYDGEGLWIIDGYKSYVVRGVSRDPYPYFSGYVTKTGQTESIFYTGNQYTYDAAICEYVSQKEYEEAQSRFSQEQSDAYSRYNQEMKEYRESLANYNYFKKNEPLIKKRISEIISSIQITVSQIKGV